MYKTFALPSANYFKKIYPLTDQLKKTKRQSDRLVQDAVTKSKFLVVVGPCSADDVQAVIEYATKLSQLKKSLSDKIVLAMRIFTAKPRTDGDGYQGVLFHRHEDAPYDLQQGIVDVRQMMLFAIQLGLPVADELLYPDCIKYYGDLVSYYSLGARSSMDALHRGFASGLNVPVGVKNSIDGDIVAMVKGVYAISRPKTFPYGGKQIVTNGNKLAHAVLRGYHDGNKFVNNMDSASTVRQLYQQYDVANSFVMVDCSHANSGKVAKLQIDNALQCARDKNVGGIMLESYLFGGQAKQCYGVSKTDECLSFDQTELLLKQVDELVNLRSK